MKLLHDAPAALRQSRRRLEFYNGSIKRHYVDDKLCISLGRRCALDKIVWHASERGNAYI